MLDFIYYLCIFPLEEVMALVLHKGFTATASWGTALVLMSIAVNTALIPLYHIAETWQQAERLIQQRMAPKLAEFKEVFTGRARYMIVKTLYRQNGYSPLMALRTSAGLLIQIPFFFAAYHLLQNAPELKGVSLWLLHDLAAPDALLSFGGMTINLLPFVMTAVNLLSAAVYTTGLTRKDRMQLYGLAALFFVLLYNASAALLIYWTCNNIFSLGKNIVYRACTTAEGTYALPPAWKRSLMMPFSGTAFLLRWGAHHLPSCTDIILFFLSGGLFAAALYAQRKTGLHAGTITCITAAATCGIAAFSLRLFRYTTRINAVLSQMPPSRHNIAGTIGASSLPPANAALWWNIALLAFAVAFVTGGLTSYKRLTDPVSWWYFRLFALTIGCLAGYAFARFPFLWLLECADSFCRRTLPAAAVSGFAVAGPLILGLLLFWYTPSQLYISDPLFFHEALPRLAAAATLYLLAFLAVFWVIRLFSPKGARPFQAALFGGLGLAGMLFVFVAKGDYGVMDGFLLQEPGLLKTRWGIVIDLAVAFAAWGIIYLAARLRKTAALAQMLQGVACLLALLVIIPLARLPHLPVLDFTEASIRLPDYNDRLSNFSPRETNVLVLMLDMFTGGHVQKILEEEPALATQLDGFVWYPDTLAPGATTLLSIASLTGGENYTAHNINKKKPKNLEDVMLEGFSTIPKTFVPQGFDVTMADIEGLIPQDLEQQCPEAKEVLMVGKSFITAYTGYWRNRHNRPSPLPESHMPFLAASGLLQAAPWVLRQHIYHNGAWLGTQTMRTNTSEGPYAFLDSLPHVASATMEKPTFKFITSLVSHYPWQLDPVTCLPDAGGTHTEKDGIIMEHYYAERCALRGVARFIDWLKHENIYDNTMIVLVSDHDGNDSAAFDKTFNKFRKPKTPWKPHALLMVKGLNAQGPLRTDTTLMASTDILPLVCAETGICPEGTPPDPRTLTERIRTHDSGMASIRRHKKDRFIIDTFSVNGTMFNPENWKELP